MVINRLVVRRIDPMSMTKTAFFLSLAMAVVIIVAISLMWALLAFAGFFDAIGGTIGDLAGSGSAATSIFSFTRVLGFTLVISAVEIVTMTGFATLFAVLYNLTVRWAGGLTVSVHGSSGVDGTADFLPEEGLR